MPFTVSFFLLLTLLSAGPAQAQYYDRIGFQLKVMEALSLDEDLLEKLDERLKFPPVKHEDLIPFTNAFTKTCPNSKKIVRFEPKPGDKHYWGIKVPIPVGIVAYQPRNPNEKPIVRPNRFKIDKCTIKDSVLQAVLAVVCDPQLAGDLVLVKSAFRDPIANAKVGGKSKSYHMLCNALDFSTFRFNRNTQGYDFLSNRTVQTLARKEDQVTGMGKGKSFTHIDTRPKRNGPKPEWDYPE